MTHKTYNLIESDQNGDQLEVKSYETRFEAVQAMATRLMADDTTQPQNFRIEEVHQVDEEATLMDIANKIANDLKDFGCNLDVRSYLTDGSGFVELYEAIYQYPSMSRLVLQHIFDLIDEFNAGLEGYEVLMSITHECAIRLILSKKENK